MTGKSKPEEAILATIDSFPYELLYIAGARSLPGSEVLDKNTRYESVKVQKRLIKEEERRKKLMPKMKQYDATQDDLALNEMTIPVAYAAVEQDRASAGNKQEKLCEISHTKTVFATALPVITECEKFLMLVKKEADVMLRNLEKEIDDVDAKIGYRWRGLGRYCEGTVSPEVVAAAALCLKDAMGKEGIQKFISNISKYNGVDLVPGSMISHETLITRVSE